MGGKSKGGEKDGDGVTEKELGEKMSMLRKKKIRRVDGESMLPRYLELPVREVRKKQRH